MERPTYLRIEEEIAIMEKKWTATQKKRVAFFYGLLEKSKGRTSLFSGISIESGYYHAICQGAGLSKVLYKYYMPQSKNVIELTIERDKEEETINLYNYLYEQKDNIEEEFGDELLWAELGKKRAAIRKEITNGILMITETWPLLQDKMIDAMIRFEGAIRPRIEEFKRNNNIL